LGRIRRWIGDATTTVEKLQSRNLGDRSLRCKSEKLIWRGSSSDTLSDKATRTQRTSKRREQNVPAFSPPRDETLRERMNRYLTFSLAISITLSTPAFLCARQTSRAGEPEGQLYYGRTMASRGSEPESHLSGRPKSRTATTEARGAFTVRRDTGSWVYAEQASRPAAELESREAKLSTIVRHSKM